MVNLLNDLLNFRRKQENLLSTVGKRAKKEVAATRQRCYQPHPRSATNPALACVSELDPRLSLGSFTITYVESGVNTYFQILIIFFR